jgi:hypothetical protein
MRKFLIYLLVMFWVVLISVFTLDSYVSKKLNQALHSNEPYLREVVARLDMDDQSESAYARRQQCEDHHLGYGYIAQTCLSGRLRRDGEDRGFSALRPIGEKDGKTVYGTMFYLRPAQQHITRPFFSGIHQDTKTQTKFILSLDGMIVENF